jgi:hypothetical protein
MCPFGIASHICRLQLGRHGDVDVIAAVGARDPDAAVPNMLRAKAYHFAAA